MPDVRPNRRGALFDEPRSVIRDSYFTVKLTWIVGVMFPSLPVNVRVKVR
jgi:hypothetical protein